MTLLDNYGNTLEKINFKILLLRKGITKNIDLRGSRETTTIVM